MYSEKQSMKDRRIAISFQKETNELLLDVLSDGEKRRLKLITDAEEEELKLRRDAKIRQLNQLKQSLSAAKEAVKEAENAMAIDNSQANATALQEAKNKFNALLQQQKDFEVQRDALTSSMEVARQKAEEKRAQIKKIAAENLNRSLSGIDRIEYQRQIKERAEQALEEERFNAKLGQTRLKQITQQKRQLGQEIAKEQDAQKREQLQQQLDAIEEERKVLDKQYGIHKKNGQLIQNESMKRVKNLQDASSNAEEEEKKLQKYSLNGVVGARKKFLEDDTKAREQENAKLKTNIAIDEGRRKELLSKGEENLSDEEKALLEQLGKNIAENSEKVKENNKQISKNTLQLGKEAAKDKAKELFNQGLKEIDNKISIFYGNAAKYNARLYGIESGSSAFGGIPVVSGGIFGQQAYNRLLNTVSQQIGLNPLVSQVAVIQNIQKLIDSGVAQNVELRAYLATISDNIASTFDAMDGVLLRLTRIQQSDSTAYRLGMEAALTEFFNKKFADSTFMNDMHDTVFGAIYDANSLMTAEESSEFEYVVQKWLGSLYSVGMSQEGIQKIATGLNYLGTGNYSGMASDESLQNIFAMSASRAGLNYAELLQRGLDKSSVNKLLESMVGYLRDISQNTLDNKVVANAFSNVFGMSVSDMSSILNLSDEDISSIVNETLTYKGMGENLVAATGRILKNTHISQLTNNLFDNAVTTAATGIGDSIVNYVIWKTANTLMDLGIDVPLPFVNVLGFGVDLHTTLLSLVKTGVAGISLMGQLISGVLGGSLNNVGMFLGLGNVDSLYNSWGATQVTERGQTRQDILKGLQRYKSYSVSIDAPFQRAPLPQEFQEEQWTDEKGGGNTEDIQKQSLTNASDDAKDMGDTINGQEGMPEKTTADIYDALFTYKFPVYTIDLLALGQVVNKSPTTQSKLSYLNYINSIADADISKLKEDSKSYDEQVYKSVTSSVQEISSEIPNLLLPFTSEDDQSVLKVDINNIKDVAKETLKQMITEAIIAYKLQVSQKSTAIGPNGEPIEDEPVESVESQLQKILQALNGELNVSVKSVDPGGMSFFV